MQVQRIVQHFKVPAAELTISSLEDAVLTRIAAKEVF